MLKRVVLASAVLAAALLPAAPATATDCSVKPCAGSCRVELPAVQEDGSIQPGYIRCYS